MLRNEVRTRTSVHAGFQPHEVVNRIRLLPSPFSIENGTLTHTLKLKRNVVAEKYDDLIRSMY